MSSFMCTASIAVIAALACGAHSASAQEQDFFKGKTVNILIGFGPGGANDVWARTIAKHIANHLPGHPTVVPQNAPGAGGLKLMNTLYNVSPKDGTAIGLVNRGIPLEPLLGGAGTQFDPMKMTWIGSPDKDITVCAARKDAPVQTMQDLFTKELVVGATGSGADTAIYPEFLSELIGMKFRTIKGYPGSKDISLAMERNEVQGICLAYDSLQRQTLAREGKINILFQAALKPDPRLKNVPVGTDLARSEDDRQALQLFFARVALGRPFVAPPGLSAARTTTLRTAFDETMKDPQFLADAKKQDLSVDAITGQEIADIIAAVYKTPKDIVKRTSEALGRAGKDEKAN
jgi:tripartite-type tricarboxylate transporter receptor subunit TctC